MSKRIVSRKGSKVASPVVPKPKKGIIRITKEKKRKSPKKRKPEEKEFEEGKKQRPRRKLILKLDNEEKDDEGERTKYDGLRKFLIVPRQPA